MSRIAQLERLHAADPADADVPYMLAQEHAKAGDYAGAVRWFDRCLEASPGYCYAYFHKARALESAGRAEDARDALRAGAEASRRAGDAKALSEISAYLETLGG